MKIHLSVQPKSTNIIELLDLVKHLTENADDWGGGLTLDVFDVQIEEVDRAELLIDRGGLCIVAPDAEFDVEPLDTDSEVIEDLVWCNVHGTVHDAVEGSDYDPYEDETYCNDYDWDKIERRVVPSASPKEKEEKSEKKSKEKEHSHKDVEKFDAPGLMADTKRASMLHIYNTSREETVTRCGRQATKTFDHLHPKQLGLELCGMCEGSVIANGPGDELRLLDWIYETLDG